MPGKIEGKNYLFWLASLAVHGCFALIPLYAVSRGSDECVSVKMRISRILEKKRPEKKIMPKKQDFFAESAQAENIPAQERQSDEIPQLDFSSIEGPKIKGRFSPSYPYAAKKMGKEGVVKARILIDERGKAVSWTFIESCGSEFEKSVEEEIKKADFMPAVRDGRAIASYGVLPVRFEIRE